MAFTKHTQAESAEVVSPEEHQQISDALRREGKVKLSDVEPEKRKTIVDVPFDVAEWGDRPRLLDK